MTNKELIELAREHATYDIPETTSILLESLACRLELALADLNVFNRCHTCDITDKAICKACINHADKPAWHWRYTRGKYNE